ncbi:MAG: hypothetical protein ACR2RD_02970 [Woeseiaceae bacterium]
MSTPIERRQLIEAIHNQGVEYENLLRIVVPLAQAHDKAFVVNVFAVTLNQIPFEKDDCVLLGNLALRFDNDGRLIDVFKVVPGTTERAEIVIKSSTDL